VDKVPVLDENNKSTTILSSSKEEANLMNVQEWSDLRHQVTLLAETLEKMGLAEYIAVRSLALDKIGGPKL